MAFEVLGLKSMRSHTFKYVFRQNRGFNSHSFVSIDFYIEFLEFENSGVGQFGSVAAISTPICDELDFVEFMAEIFALVTKNVNICLPFILQKRSYYIKSLCKISKVFIRCIKLLF